MKTSEERLSRLERRVQEITAPLIRRTVTRRPKLGMHPRWYGAPPAATKAHFSLLGLIALALLLFALCGFVGVNTVLRDALGGEPPWPSVAALFFASALASILIGAVAAIVRSVPSLRVENALRAAHPERPWMWREEWIGEIVEVGAPKLRAFLVAVTIVWIAISLPVVAVVIRLASAKPSPAPLLIHPAAGLAPLAIVLYQGLRALKYGRSRVRVASIPLVPRGPIRGELLARFAEHPPRGFTFRLTCVERTARGSGRNLSTSLQVLWSAEQTVEAGAAIPTLEGMRVPFVFTVPPDMPESDDRLPQRAVTWRLDVRAAVPGIGYRARFELPVFDPDYPR